MGFTLPGCRATLRRAHLVIIFVFLYLLSRIGSTICLPTLPHMPELWHGSASFTASHSGFHAISLLGFLFYFFSSLGVASVGPPFTILRDFLVDSVRVMFRLRVSFSSSYFFLQTFKAYLRADREK